MKRAIDVGLLVISLVLAFTESLSRPSGFLRWVYFIYSKRPMVAKTLRVTNSTW